MLFAAALATFSWPSDARAQLRDIQDGTAIPGAANTREEATPQELRDVGIDEHLDAQVPMDASFTDEGGKSVRLGDLFDGKRPVLLTLAYYSCPTLCSLVLSSEAESLAKTTWTIGKEYDVVTISIDPHETAEKTNDKKKALLERYLVGHPDAAGTAASGWHFLRTADDATIHRVADAVGFRYKYDEEGKQYGHPAALILLKPNGRVSRYLYGIEFPPADVKLGLLEASEGKSISAVEQVILFCYRYDKNEGKYVLIANRVMRIGGGFCALILAAFLALLWRRERHPKRKTGGHAPGTDSPIVPMENHT
jgi:protein SCO1/2